MGIKITIPLCLYETVQNESKDQYSMQGKTKQI